MGKLSLKSVWKRFGTLDVIQGVDLEVLDREFVVFVGPSGCGKSTLLRMIAGLEDVTLGEIHIDGRRVNDLAPVKRGISMVFQSYALYPHMSVFENIAFPLRVESMSQTQVIERVDRAAKILKLEDRLQHKPGQLSGGQRQRVAIGRAIVREPSVFLFDEPLSNLDAALRLEMRLELSKLHGALGATMIYVTHDQVEAMTMADRIVVLNLGVIAQIGSPLELYHKPADTFVAGFIGSPKMNFLDVTCSAVDDGGVTVGRDGLGQAKVPVTPKDGLVGQRLTLGVRPEHAKLGGGDLSFEMKPSVIEQLGMHTVAYGEFEGSTNNFCALFPGESAVRPDQSLATGFAAADCHLFDKDGNALERRVDLSDIDISLMTAAPN